MTTLENLYFGNNNPSEYKYSKDARKKLSETIALINELKSLNTTERQKEKLAKIDNCQMSLIVLSECDAFIKGFKIGVKITTEIYADRNIDRYTTVGITSCLPRCLLLYNSCPDSLPLAEKNSG